VTRYNEGIKRIVRNRDAMITREADPDAAKEKWAEMFETEYIDDFDKSLIAATTC
jgi:hypothetical protein